MKLLSVVIPAYDEIGTIDEILRRVMAADRCGLSLEIVVVDDASTDGTDREKLKLPNEDANVSHPGPADRDVAPPHDLPDHPPSENLHHARNGLAVRTAVLYHLSGRVLEGEPKDHFDGRNWDGNLDALRNR